MNPDGIGVPFDGRVAPAAAFSKLSPYAPPFVAGGLRFPTAITVKNGAGVYDSTASNSSVISTGQQEHYSCPDDSSSIYNHGASQIVSTIGSFYERTGISQQLLSASCRLDALDNASSSTPPSDVALAQLQCSEEFLNHHPYVYPTSTYTLATITNSTACNHDNSQVVHQKNLMDGAHDQPNVERENGTTDGIHICKVGQIESTKCDDNIKKSPLCKSRKEFPHNSGIRVEIKDSTMYANKDPFDKDCDSDVDSPIYRGKENSELSLAMSSNGSSVKRSEPCNDSMSGLNCTTPTIRSSVSTLLIDGCSNNIPSKQHFKIPVDSSSVISQNMPIVKGPTACNDTQPGQNENIAIVASREASRERTALTNGFWIANSFKQPSPFQIGSSSNISLTMLETEKVDKKPTDKKVQSCTGTRIQVASILPSRPSELKTDSERTNSVMESVPDDGNPPMDPGKSDMQKASKNSVRKCTQLVVNTLLCQSEILLEMTNAIELSEEEKKLLFQVISKIGMSLANSKRDDC